MLDTTKFVAACCRWPQNSDTQGVVAKAAAQIEDWDDARRVVERHRVFPLVHLAVKDLECVPKDFRDWARQQAQRATQNAMQLTRECLRIDAAFIAADLEPLHFKGPTLAQIAYGSVAVKVSHDLDIFIEAADIHAAVALLEADGYRVLGRDAPLSARQVSAIVRNFKDICLVGPTGIMVELHWRFVHSKKLLTELNGDLQTQGVTVATTANLRTLGSLQMLQYLCVHGALHHWKRLKWLADLAAFLNQLPVAERDQIIADTSKTSASVALAQSLKLCDTLFGTQYAPTMSDQAKAIYAYGLSCIEAPYDGTRRFGLDVGIIKDVIATRHLHPTRWGAIAAFKRLLIRQDDVLDLPLPAALNGLYLAIRLPALLLRRLRR